MAHPPKLHNCSLIIPRAVIFAAWRDSSFTSLQRVQLAYSKSWPSTGSVGKKKKDLRVNTVCLTSWSMGASGGEMIRKLD